MAGSKRMAKSDISKELEAIKAVTEALSPLDGDVRKRVLLYVLEHLGIRLQNGHGSESPPTLPLEPTHPEAPGAPPGYRIVDIRSLRQEKNPTSDVQMAAVVAYYLSKLAPSDERKDTVTAADIKKYFDQAGHPLPADANMTLNNARKAGYLDRVDRGQFRLNPVGHNLVVHGLPKSADSSSVPVKRSKKNRGGRPQNRRKRVPTKSKAPRKAKRKS